ncbi:MAG: class I SAM-dependent methyltransferase [Planctomycetota bacterium]
MNLPALYGELAGWWPLLSSPDDYAEEAGIYVRAIRDACTARPQTVLELGCGGGNCAQHMKAAFELTLVELSPGMLAVSRAANPECEHLLGDMRDVRLGRVFDAVFVHDAISYMTSEADLRRAIETAYAHCRDGGAALFVPDRVRETFQPSTHHGGHDGEQRSLRYMEWVRDPGPDATTYVADFAYLLQEGDAPPRVVQDRHTFGLFPQETWIRAIGEAGFRPSVVPIERGEDDLDGALLFVGTR